MIILAVYFTPINGKVHVYMYTVNSRYSGFIVKVFIASKIIEFIRTKKMHVYKFPKSNFWWNW